MSQCHTQDVDSVDIIGNQKASVPQHQSYIMQIQPPYVELIYEDGKKRCYMDINVM